MDYMVKTWGGSCYGLSSWVCMVNNGTQMYPYGKLHDADGGDLDMISAVNFYHFQQLLSQNVEETISTIANDTIVLGVENQSQINRLESIFSDGKAHVICYDHNIIKAHAVVGIYIRNVKDGEKTLGGKDLSGYDKCIVVYDSNATEADYSENSDYNIYYNSKTGRITIPKHFGTKLVNISKSDSYVNVVDYNTGEVRADYGSSKTNFIRTTKKIKFQIKTDNNKYIIYGTEVESENSDEKMEAEIAELDAIMANPDAHPEHKVDNDFYWTYGKKKEELQTLIDDWGRSPKIAYDAFPV